MKLFTKSIESGETYTAEDFLNENEVIEAFSNESGTTLKITAVYEEDTFVRMKSISFDNDEENGYGDYEAAVYDFFGTLGNRIFSIMLKDRRILHKDFENQ